MTLAYEDFIASKARVVKPSGFTVDAVNESLFPFQRDLVKWALKRGKAALFASTGLGKSRMEVEFCRHVVAHTGKPVLILTPLAVAQQFVGEGLSLGVDVKVCREAADVVPGVNVTNYERLHKFDTSIFGGVAADESSVAKNFNSKTLDQLLTLFADTPYKLSATATPAPNDYTELGTQAEFLGVCKRMEMLAEFFVHDGGETQVWRLKRHAVKEYWKWVASWAALIRKPSDLNYPNDGYDLPPLNIRQHTTPTDLAEARAAGNLFVTEATDLMERRRARKASITKRVAACAAQVAAEPGEKWVVWCDLNAEQDALEEVLGDDCVSIYGSLDADEKERRMGLFLRGEKRILLSKCSICGAGVNLQFSARMAFVGVTDSWEAYFQALRRQWRFGQTRAVDAHIFASEAEGSIIANLKRKEADAEKMAEELSAQTRDAVLAEVRGMTRHTIEYNPSMTIQIPNWVRTEA